MFIQYVYSFYTIFIQYLYDIYTVFIWYLYNIYMIFIQFLYDIYTCILNKPLQWFETKLYQKRREIWVYSNWILDAKQNTLNIGSNKKQNTHKDDKKQTHWINNAKNKKYNESNPIKNKQKTIKVISITFIHI